MNLVIIKHDNDPRKFLFQVPDHVYLKKGDRVICKTRHGESDGTCVYDSFTLDGPALDIFIREIGAKKPLAPIIGGYQKVVYKTEIERIRFILERKKAIESGEEIPCNLCQYGPPTVTPGKPCFRCPAEGFFRIRDEMSRPSSEVEGR